MDALVPRVPAQPLPQMPEQKAMFLSHDEHQGPTLDYAFSIPGLLKACVGGARLGGHMLM